MNEEKNSPGTIRRISRNKSRPDGALSVCYDWLSSFIAALLCVVLLFTFVFRVVRVSGNSMLPTLQDGDMLIISDVLYTPKTGDIVVVQVPTYKNGLPLIKRVIATEGQKVKIDFKTWSVTVDGVKLDESYIKYMEGFAMDRHNCPTEFVVEEGKVFLMGDNRNDSNDSRNSAIGQVDTRCILGKVIFRLSPSPFGTEKNPLHSPFQDKN